VAQGLEHTNALVIVLLLSISYPPVLDRTIQAEVGPTLPGFVIPDRVILTAFGGDTGEMKPSVIVTTWPTAAHFNPASSVVLVQVIDPLMNSTGMVIDTEVPFG
jgi:hypothetical protein